MPSVRVYCECKVNEVGTETWDLYALRFDQPWRQTGRPYWSHIFDGTLPCGECGALFQYVGDEGAMSEREADALDASLTKIKES